jgi:hypothetical protein
VSKKKRTTRKMTVMKNKSFSAAVGTRLNLRYSVKLPLNLREFLPVCSIGDLFKLT